MGSDSDSVPAEAAASGVAGGADPNAAGAEAATGVELAGEASAFTEPVGGKAFKALAMPSGIGGDLGK